MAAWAGALRLVSAPLPATASGLTWWVHRVCRNAFEKVTVELASRLTEVSIEQRHEAHAIDRFYEMLLKAAIERLAFARWIVVTAQNEARPQLFGACESHRVETWAIGELEVGHQSTR